MTTTEPMTVGAVLYGSRAQRDEEVRGALRRGALAGVLAQAVTGLGAVGRKAMVDQVARAVAGLLDLDIAEELVAGVGKYHEVLDAMDRTAGPPVSEELLSLASRRLTALHRPTVDVDVDGVLVHRVRLDLRLTAILHGVAVTVGSGRITQVLGGYADLEITLDVDGVRLAEWNGTTEVPVTVAVGHAP